MKALHLGAGNIGRDFIDKLLVNAGVQLTFADANRVVLDALSVRHSHQVHVMGKNEQVDTVSDINAVNSIGDDVAEPTVYVDLITAAIGPVVLECIAPAVVKGLVKRKAQGITTSLNITACKNMVCGATQLKGHVMDALADEDKAWAGEHTGFVNSAAGRIIPPPASTTDDPPGVAVGTSSEWVTDRTQFEGELPNIPEMELTDNLMAFIERRFFTLNTGHTVTAYLGESTGHQTICDVILDEKIRAVVKGAMEESGVALIKRYSFDAAKHAVYIQKIFGRFESPYLKGDVEHVGRQPLRKLSAGNRLIRPLLGILEYGLPHVNLVTGITAAMRYHSEEDSRAQELAALIDEKDPQAALAQVSGLDANNGIVFEAVNTYNAKR